VLRPSSLPSGPLAVTTGDVVPGGVVCWGEPSQRDCGLHNSRLEEGSWATLQDGRSIRMRR
jgi:hypothetical protein